jgi:uncharacterized protein YbjT (DUF2867 family)
MLEEQAILVVGATGSLGSRAVRELVRRGRSVRALVREGTDASGLIERGVEVVRGDLVEPESLDRALAGVGALVTTAAGYTRRRKGDSLASVDDRGNRNLVDAAARAGVGRFVFTSILTCDQAREVPHFWQKKLIEDYLEASGVPFVALRPGAFVGGQDFWSKGLRKGRLIALGSNNVRWSYIHIDDVARYLARALEAPGAVGRRIDIGMDRPVSQQDVAELFTTILGRDVRLRTPPWRLIRAGMGLGGLFNPFLRDGRAMIDYFLTGRYVADTTLQRHLFGDVPTVEESLRRYLGESNLTNAVPAERTREPGGPP